MDVLDVSLFTFCFTQIHPFMCICIKLIYLEWQSIFCYQKLQKPTKDRIVFFWLLMAFYFCQYCYNMPFQSRQFDSSLKENHIVNHNSNNGSIYSDVSPAGVTTVSQHVSQALETEAATWSSAITNFIIYTCAFHTVTFKMF